MATEYFVKLWDNNIIQLGIWQTVYMTALTTIFAYLIGLSGAGKSTLVRCINLLERPTSGEVWVDGQNLTALSEKELLHVRRQIGMIFQSFNLLEQRTVLRNVCFPLEISGTPKAEARKRAAELLKVVGLADKAASFPSQLSGGQKQRVAIALSLIHI